MSHTARIFTQEQLTDALASACVLEGVSILHRFIGLTRRGQTLDGYLSCFMQNGWWTLTDADNLATVIKPDANGNPTLNTELFRSINVLKEIRP
ncbi:hypothetical protein [Bifidobacterium longum]|uniref:hypothetical protein n=1 Tax=Bifidobacterium longum TaxID=216816 RepID=UPI00216B1023|nr:hypothetical protein [Bifidobacterium longum]